MENNNDNNIIIPRECWLKMLERIDDLSSEVRILKRQHRPAKSVYTNKELRELLGVNDKLIRKYREDGLLGYSCSGGKYWHTADDIDKFLKESRCA